MQARLRAVVGNAVQLGYAVPSSEAVDVGDTFALRLPAGAAIEVPWSGDAQERLDVVCDSLDLLAAWLQSRQRTREATAASRVFLLAGASPFARASPGEEHRCRREVAYLTGIGANGSDS